MRQFPGAPDAFEAFWRDLKFGRAVDPLSAGEKWGAPKWIGYRRII
jgi:hypothetical protein